MTGTDELKMAVDIGQIAVLIDRSKSTERSIDKLGEQIEKQSGNFANLQQSLTEINERHLARSDANKAAIEAANKLIDHVRLRTIDQDTQQVLMIHQEEAARLAQDDKLRTEIASQNQKHADDMAGLATSINELKSSMRVVTVISGFLSIIASGVIVGSLLHLIPGS